MLPGTVSLLRDSSSSSAEVLLDARVLDASSLVCLYEQPAGTATIPFRFSFFSSSLDATAVAIARVGLLHSDLMTHLPLHVCRIACAPRAARRSALSMSAFPTRTTLTTFIMHPMQCCNAKA